MSCLGFASSQMLGVCGTSVLPSSNHFDPAVSQISCWWSAAFDPTQNLGFTTTSNNGLLSSFDIDDKENPEGWKYKVIDQWSPYDTMFWSISVLQLHVKNIAAVRLESFLDMCGSDLKKLSLEDFNQIMPGHGEKLYYQLQMKLNSNISTEVKVFVPRSQPLEIVLKPTALIEPSKKSYYSTIAHCEEDSGYNSDTNFYSQTTISKAKKKRGRPPGSYKKRQPHTKVGRVWEFIRDLLLDPQYCDSVVSWQDRSQGVFRFENSERAAKLWGSKKGNQKMNFGNFTRAIRQNYRTGYLQSVKKKRLVYKFGPKSHGWRLSEEWDSRQSQSV